MGNPYHDPQTGEFTDGPGGGDSTGDKTTDRALAGKTEPTLQQMADARIAKMPRAQREAALKRRMAQDRLNYDRTSAQSKIVP